jgi:hypothetical protein
MTGLVSRSVPAAPKTQPLAELSSIRECEARARWEYPEIRPVIAKRRRRELHQVALEPARRASRLDPIDALRLE